MRRLGSGDAYSRGVFRPTFEGSWSRHVLCDCEFTRSFSAGLRAFSKCRRLHACRIDDPACHTQSPLGSESRYEAHDNQIQFT